MRPFAPRLRPLAAVLVAAAAACGPARTGPGDAAAADSAVPLPPPAVPHAADTAAADRPRHVVYVPVYSRVPYGPSGRTVPLAATLSIRNTDPERAITVHEVRFHDTGGALLRAYLERPVRLAPMASVAYVVASGDDAGGTGANFIVQWSAPGPVTEPVIETVMIGSSGGQGISFTSPGRTLVRH